MCVHVLFVSISYSLLNPLSRKRFRFFAQKGQKTKIYLFGSIYRKNYTNLHKKREASLRKRPPEIPKTL